MGCRPTPSPFGLARVLTDRAGASCAYDGVRQTRAQVCDVAAYTMARASDSQARPSRPHPRCSFKTLSQLMFLPPGIMQTEEKVQLAPLLAASTPADDGSSSVYSVSLRKRGEAAASVEKLRKSLSGCSVGK